MINRKNFERGHIRGVKMLKNTDGLYKLLIETRGKRVSVVSKFKGNYSLIELIGKEVVLKGGLKPIRLWSNSNNEVIQGAIQDDFYSVLLLLNGKFILN